ncbi:MAG TPA: cyclic nucleotide-binding domain-containing protein [Roseiflexaceae bacterium]|nr:cyclic nucleotide-binding domain-containing protein [Roseiflexaceae bacterium]
MSGSNGHHRADPPARQYAQALAQQEEERRDRQVDALAQLDCLRGVPRTDLARLADLGVLRAFIPGTVILSERTPCDFVYLILRGTVRLTLHDRAGHEVLISVLNRGDCFGEGPLFGDLFRGASVHAETICYLLQVARESLRAILDSAPELAAALRTIYRQRMVESTLGRVPLFGRLSPLERAQVAALLRVQHYARGATIIHEGTPGQALYLIEEGQVVVEQGGQAIAHLDEGDFFGEMSLLAQSPHNADVRALSPVEVLALPAAEFSRLLKRQPALNTQLQEVANQRRAANATIRRDQERANQLTAAVERGLLRGTHVLVRDPQLCQEGCTICQDACASRHGQARIRLNGVMLDGQDITDSCRQCRVGAECVEACPADAIHWGQNGALLITDACTGCGACVPACPYDAVKMVRHDQAATSPLWLLWRRLKRPRQAIIPLETSQPQMRADKCDLCYGYDDLACVSACPSGALQLRPVEDLFPF